MNNSTYLVLVYGSLRSGLGNHGYLRSSEFKKYLILSGFRMYDNYGYYPYVYYTGDKSKKILGEVYEVDDATLKNLDRLEGISRTNGDDGHYKRRRLGDSEIWMYIATGTHDGIDLPEVPPVSEILSGDESDKYDFADWKTYLKHRSELIDDDYGYNSRSYSYSGYDYSKNYNNNDVKESDELEDLSYEALADKYSARVEQYKNKTTDELRELLKSMSSKYERASNITLIKHYYNLIQLIGWTIKHREDESDSLDENALSIRNSMYKFLDNVHLKQLSELNSDLYDEIVKSVNDDRFERLYADLFKLYESTTDEERKGTLGDYLELIDKALSADSNLRQIEAEISKYLGESAHIYMKSIRFEPHGVLSALLEEVRTNN